MYHEVRGFEGGEAKRRLGTLARKSWEKCLFKKGSKLFSVSCNEIFDILPACNSLQP